MSFFDDSHVTDIGLQGSLGPSVGFFDMVQQSYRQQFRVDSARALDDELRNRWLESLRMAQIADGEAVDPFDPYAYRAFAQHAAGQPIDTFDPNKPLFGEYDPTARIRGMIDANEKIKQLNDPKIKSFEQILEEVAQMQHEVEGETASEYERTGTGGFIASLLGAIGGSFTTRDPLNIITAPIGAGRTVATRIASEIGIAAGVTGYTELAEVAPARQIVGLPERNPLFNIAAAAIGAGVIRGGIEGVGYGLGRLRGEDIDFDFRDAQLKQMFEANSDKPSARAGAMILDDTTFIERNNPFGEGRASQERFIAELTEVQKAMNGAPMTAVGRVMPPLPFEYIKKAADFEIVREQAPDVWAKMEAAQAKVTQLQSPEYYHAGPTNITRFSDEYNRSGQPKTNDDFGGIYFSSTKEGASNYLREGGQLYSTRLDIKNPLQLPSEQFPEITTGALFREEIDALKAAGYDAVVSREGNEVVVFSPEQVKIVDPISAAERRKANAEYQSAYRAVEAEATRLNTLATKTQDAQQGEGANILAQAYGRPFIGPLLRHNNVESLVERINKFNETLDEDTIARFTRETVGEGEETVEREAWRTEDGRVDIGLREPVDPEFRFVTDDGEMTVAAAMRDLQDDADLVDAVKVCSV